MAYFPNATAGECYEAQYCNHCIHQAKGDDDPGCVVMLAHILYAYKLCNETDHPGKHILDLLIPVTNGGIGADRCTMFARRNALSDKRLKDWAKYKQAMSEMDNVVPTAAQSAPL